MLLRNWPFLLVGGIVLAVHVSWIVNSLRYGGFRAAMLGGRIRRTVGEVALSKKWLTRRKILVLDLEVPGSGERRIGVEVESRTLIMSNATPLSLSRDEVRALTDLLTQALAR